MKDTRGGTPDTHAHVLRARAAPGVCDRPDTHQMGATGWVAVCLPVVLTADTCLAHTQSPMPASNAKSGNRRGANAGAPSMKLFSHRGEGPRRLAAVCK